MLDAGHLEVAHRPVQRGGRGGQRPAGRDRDGGVARAVHEQRRRPHRGRAAEQVEAVEVDADPPLGDRASPAERARAAAAGCGPAGAAWPASRPAGRPRRRRPPGDASADRSRNAPVIAPPIDQPNSTIRARAAVRGVPDGGLDVLPLGVAEVVVAVRAGRRALVVAVGDHQRRVPARVQRRQDPQRLAPRAAPAVHQHHPGVAVRPARARRGRGPAGRHVDVVEGQPAGRRDPGRTARCRAPPRVPGAGTGPPSSGRTTSARFASAPARSPRARPRSRSAQRSPQMPGCAVSRLAASVTVPSVDGQHPLRVDGPDRVSSRTEE